MATKLALVGEAWGETEEALKHPFVGTSGIELLKMLHEAEILQLDRNDWDCIDTFWRTRDGNYTKLVWRNHKDIALFNVFNLRPVGNKIETLCGPKKEDTTGLPPLSQGKYFKAEYLPHVEELRRNLRELKPNLTVLLGNTPCWAILGRTAITRIRGGITASPFIDGLKCLPILHPAAILRQWENRHVTVLDLIKARRESEFPDIRRPRRHVWIEPTLDDLDRFYNDYLESAEYIAPDIETAASQITCIGFSPRPDIAIVVPFLDTTRVGNNYWETSQQERLAWEWVRKVLDHPAPKVFQNGIYDIHFLFRGYGIKVRNVAHDTMLLHHALQPEAPKGLGFLGSVYTNEASWKVTMRDRKAKNQTLKRDDE